MKPKMTRNLEGNHNIYLGYRKREMNLLLLSLPSALIEIHVQHDLKCFENKSEWSFLFSCVRAISCKNSEINLWYKSMRKESEIRLLLIPSVQRPTTHVGKITMRPSGFFLERNKAA
jgi:hypothetical protein